MVICLKQEANDLYMESLMPLKTYHPSFRKFTMVYHSGTILCWLSQKKRPRNERCCCSHINQIQMVIHGDMWNGYQWQKLLQLPAQQWSSAVIQPVSFQ